MLEQVVQHLARLGVALELDEHAHAGAVGFVAQVGDAVDLPFLDQLGDPLEQVGLVDLVGELGDDDLEPVAARRLFNECFGADDDAAATGGVGGLDALSPEDGAAGREVGAFDDLPEFLEGGFRVVDQEGDRIADLDQVVGRDVGCHADGDAGRSVDEQVGQPGGQDPRLLERGVVVGGEVDGLLVDVDQELVGDGGETGFGVAHCRGAVAVDRAEVALAVDERVAQVEVLRHAHERVVNRAVAVGVVVLEDLADDAGALAVAGVVAKAHLLHRVEDAAMDRFETVAGVGQRALDDDAHRVVEIRLAHLRFDARDANVTNIQRSTPCRGHEDYPHEGGRPSIPSRGHTRRLAAAR